MIQSCDQTQSAARRVQLASITSASLAQATVQPLDYYDHTGHSGAEVTEVAVGVLDMDRDTSIYIYRYHYYCCMCICTNVLLFS